MPSPDGFELMGLLRPWIEGRSLPILVCASTVTAEEKERLLASGAKDFVSKPFDRTEVLPRVRNLLEARFLQLDLRRKNLSLEKEVSLRAEDLHNARLEALQRLALAAEYRDDESGGHSLRIGRTSEALARELPMPEEELELIRLAAPLHDVGKIGIPDRILLKQGTLSDREFEVMKTHVAIGALILSGSRSPIMQMAEQIVLTHHEWWDGSGYPNGLKGEEIPLVGRIVAVADALDSLTQERPYKHALSAEDALEEIKKRSGSQFDPAVVDALEQLDMGWLVGPLDAGDLILPLPGTN
jgi:putative two-component system response regulator